MGQEEEKPLTLKAITQQYLDETGLIPVLYDVVNAALAVRDDDAFGVISRLLAERAHAALPDRFVAHNILDAIGQPAIQIDLYSRGCYGFGLASSAIAPLGTGERKSIDVIISEVNALTPSFQLLEEADRGFAVDPAADFALSVAAARFLAGTKELFEFLVAPETKIGFPRPIFDVVEAGPFKVGIAPRSDIGFPEQLRMAAEVFSVLGRTYPAVGTSGGRFSGVSLEAAINGVVRAGELAIYEPGVDFGIVLNIGAQRFFAMLKPEGVKETKGVEIPLQKYYELDGSRKTADEFGSWLHALIKKYAKVIFGVIDPFEERDEGNWAALAPLGLVVPRAARAIDVQAGTISSILGKGGASSVALTSDVDVIGDAAADVALAMGAGFVAFGGLARGEHAVKWNRLLRVYERLRFAGRLL